MPHPLFPPSFEHAFHAARGCICLFRLPARHRSQTRHCPGLSVRGGPMRVDGATNPELIHQYVQGLTLSRMPFGTPLRRAGITNPMVVEMHRWDGSHVSFLRKTEPVGALRGSAKPWVGAATWGSRAALNFLTTDTPGNGIRPVGARYGIPAFFNTCPPFGRRAVNPGIQRHAKQTYF